MKGLDLKFTPELVRELQQFEEKKPVYTVSYACTKI